MTITESNTLEIIYYKGEIYIRIAHLKRETISWWHIIADGLMKRIDDYAKLETQYSKQTDTLLTTHLTPLSSTG